MFVVAFLSCGSRSGSRRTSSKRPMTPIFSSPFMSKSCECLETQCRSTLRTLLVAALRMMNSLSQDFSELLNPWELLCPAAAVAMAKADAGDIVQREFSPDVTPVCL